MKSSGFIYAPLRTELFSVFMLSILIILTCVRLCGSIFLKKIMFIPAQTGEMVRQARVLAQATSDLVNAMRSDAEAEVDVDNSKKLLAAAKLLADATARMVEAAKVRSSLSRCDPTNVIAGSV